jgi:lysophospholipase L1-like esterase
MNLDRVLPWVAPLLGTALRSRQVLREAQFAAVPATPGRVVFLGDSITEWTAWEDWFPDLRTVNRGIGGQAICHVVARLQSAIHAPRAISLLIGTNDLHGLGKSSKIADIAEQMGVLVRTIRIMAPDATLLVNSVLPRSIVFRDRLIDLNGHYRQIAEANAATYVDLWPVMAGPDGAILPALTADGLHLSVAGYKAWADILRPHLAPFAT